MKIPDQYLPVMPYIITDHAEAFLDFTKKVLDAREQLIVPGEGNRTIMHGEIRIGDAVIMFAQKPDNYETRSCGMFIYVADVDTVYQKALLQKAVSLMPPVRQNYGYTAGFEDPFGNQWWVVTP
ncbi:VOC family protein [Flavobacterium supellecticarium]|uniref:VOC family protein n=1 Tax=Flavobacterium supellecticarium TaxID=2565924 RepID=A0A4V3W8L0_9FLAO|nr:VOC family protein [Flavobacterium supellecticarium]THF51590.1 VOC family protein [Flavobacterium supellecticarium]